MLTFGIDIIVLALLGVLCLAALYLWCKLTCISQEEGEGMLKGAAFAVMVMLVGYVIMAHVLDKLV